MLCLRKISEDLALLCREDILSRCEVIWYEDHTIPMENLLRPDLVEGLNGKRCGDIVSKGKIDPDIEEVPGGNRLLAGMAGQDLFCNGHWSSFWHGYIPTNFCFLNSILLRALI
jgi:hypothetical protein